MQLPVVNASSEAHLVFVSHVEGAVEAWGDVEIITAEQQKSVADVGAMLMPLIAGLRAAVQATENAEHAAAKAAARFRVRDVVLDLRVMGASDAVLNGPAFRKRDSPYYLGVFGGDNAGDITRAKMREEPELARKVVTRLDKSADFAGKAPVRDALADAIEKSIIARDALDAANLDESKAGDAELMARLALRMGLEKAYGMLRATFPGQRDFVESFFPRTERATAKSSGEAAEPPASPEAGAKGGGKAGDSEGAG